MPLTLLVFLGSIRDSTPPRLARLGLRVARACVARLAADGHDAVLIDPLDIDPNEVDLTHEQQRIFADFSPISAISA